MGTTAEKLTYLNETKGKIKDSINNLGGSIDSNTTFRDYATQLDSIYSRLPKVSGTGSNITLTPTLKGRLGSVINGDTYQQTYTGKNLFDGIFELGSIDNSTGSNVYDNQAIRSKNYIKVNPDITYTVSTENNCSIFVHFYSEDKTYLSYNNVQNTPKTFTTPNNCEYIKLRTRQAENITDLSLKCQLELGSTATSYEPYVGGQASPNPDYPQDIQCVEGIQNISVYGKNLINFSKTPFVLNNTKDYLFENDILKIESVTGGIYQNFWWEIGDLKDYAGKTLTLSYESANISGTNARKVIAIGKCDNNHNNRVNIVQVYENYNSATAIIPEPDETYTKLIVGFWVSLNNSTNDGDYTEYVKPQLEIGSTPTTYQPYQTPQTVEVDLGNIKLYSGDKITGTPDNWSIVRENGRVVLDGSETWLKNGYSFVIVLSIGKPISLCSHFTDSSTSWGSSNEAYRGKYTTTNQDDRFKCMPLIDMTIEEFKTWLSNNNVTLVYKLATPTTTPITDTYLISQLNALYNAKSYNGQTNISVSGQLPMIIEASALKGEI